MSANRRSHHMFRWIALFVLIAQFTAQQSSAQTGSSQPTTAAVMLSDLHFDPFHDPAKLPQLIKAPVDQWPAILASPDSPDQPAAFAAVQSACKAKQMTDSPFVLLSSALQAAKSQSPGTRFVTVSGDLLVHDLDCRYRASLHLPKATGDDQSLSADFSEKTTVFVIHQVESTFPGVPVYFALGNNDSRCNHNRLDLHDAYLKSTAQAVIDGLVGISPAQRKLALATYQSSGYYAVTMAAPMQRTRLLVIDDIYMMAKFANCEADDTDHAGAQQQITWLNNELDASRQRGEHVWVLGHVPPTVNPVSSLLKGHALCTTDTPEGYLASDDLTNTLVSHADTVHLAIFGHTHMDELHLLGTGSELVPVKVVPSVSPVSGNRPSFTIAKVTPATSTLTDFTVYEASNLTGITVTWAKEYDFDDTYHEPTYTAKSLEDLITLFRTDATGTATESLAYQAHAYKGASVTVPPQLWQGYVCSLDHPTAKGFANCVCNTK